MVWQVGEVADVPIIGMGGITYRRCHTVLHGRATAVAIGTANFIHPYTMVDIIDGLSHF